MKASASRKILLSIAAGLAFLFGAFAAALYVDPVGLFRSLQRFRLRLAGLEHRTLPAPRGTLSYWEGGKGPLLVLVHGLGNDAGIWAPVAPALLAKHRLLVIDLPGHGTSAPASGPLGLRDEVAGLETLLAARARNERPVLVGSSLGGWVGLLYAERHPERISRLVLLDTGGYLYPTRVRFLVRNRAEARTLTRALVGPKIPPFPGFVLDDVVEKLQEGPSPRIFQSFRPADFLDRRIGRIRTPADVVWGEADGIFPVDVGRRFARELPRARFHLIPGCGHTPQAECPGRFAKLLLWILDEPPPEPTVDVPDEPWRDPIGKPAG